MDSKKIIINIGRQLGSGGLIIAKMLAESLECKFYDKEILNLAAKESGFCEKFFEQNDENKGFLHTLFHLRTPYIGSGNSSFYANNLSQENLFKFQSDVIRKAAEEGSCIFVGRAADYILRDHKNAVNIFVTADIEERVNRITERHQCSVEKAKKIIKDKESQRASFYNFYTGKRWGASESYDLCINSSLLGLEGTASYIMDFALKSLEKR